MATDTVKILVVVDSLKARTNLKKTGKVGQDAAKKIEISVNSATSALKIMQGVVGAQALIGGFQRLASAATAAFTTVISDASDAQESLSKFGIVFKDVGDAAEKVADDLAKDFGLATTAAKTLLANTGDLLAGFGFSQKAALKLSKQVQELAVDLASFTNFSGGAEGASNALTKALLGERDGLKILGIAILEEDVKKQVALNTTNGLIFATLKQAKAQAVFDIALRQSKNAIGDYARTSLEYANQQRLLEAEIQNVSEAIGREFIPIMTELTKVTINLLRENKKWLTSLATDAVFFYEYAVARATDEMEAFNIALNGTAEEYTKFNRAMAASTSEIEKWAMALGSTLMSVGFAFLYKRMAVFIAQLVTGASALGAIAIVARVAWAALTGPVGLVIITLTAVTLVFKYLIDHQANLADATETATGKLLAQAEALREVTVASSELLDVLGMVDQIPKMSIQIATTGFPPIRSEEEKKENQKILEARKAFTAEITLLNEQQRILIEEHYIKLAETDDSFYVSEFLSKQELQRDLLVAAFKFEQEKIQIKRDGIEKDRALEILSSKKSLALLTLISKQEIDFSRKLDQAKMVWNRKVAQQEAQTLQVRLSAAGNFATAGARIAKEGSLVQKTLMVANAGIAAYSAANLALAQPPGPPTTLPLFYSVLALGLTNMFAAAKFTFAKGGIVGGNSFTGDNIQARLNSGEMVLNKQQQAQLFKQANGGGGDNSEMISAINNLASRPVLLIADDQAIARSVSRGVDEGIIIGGGQ